jgi:hypothetical protein
MKGKRVNAAFRADRRRVNEALTAAAMAAALPAVAQGPASAPAGARLKVLRYAFRVAETSLDPVKINDLYSRTLTPHIFEAAYRYDPLARPIKIRPLTAAAMPEVSADFRTWTFRIRPGIYFMSDPAFKGQRRELVAQDYVYAIKRYADPANRSPGWTSIEADGYVGLAELRQECLDKKKPFDYDREIEGLRARSGSRNRSRASSRTSPAATCSARWRARSSSSTASRSTRIRSVPGRSGSCSGGAAR